MKVKTQNMIFKKLDFFPAGKITGSPIFCQLTQKTPWVFGIKKQKPKNVFVIGCFGVAANLTPFFEI